MKTGFSLCGKLLRENPVLALYWPCTGLQCLDSHNLEEDPKKWLQEEPNMAFLVVQIVHTGADFEFDMA